MADASNPLEHGKWLIVAKALELGIAAGAPLTEARWDEDALEGDGIVLVVRRGTSEVASWFSHTEIESFSVGIETLTAFEKVRGMIARL